MSDQVVEWAPYRLKTGVTEAELFKAAEELQRDFLAKQPGYIRRELVKGDDGTFIDIVWWTSRRTAEEAVANAASSASCRRYFALMQEADDAQPGAGVMHFQSLRSY